jgi:serine/threonine-protein kinase
MSATPQPADSQQTLPLSITGQMIVETLAPAEPSQARYIVTRLHAEGGLGRIWVARDRDLNRDVALKELKPLDSQDAADARERFLKEAQVTGQLEHPNIVPVYELAKRTDDARPFYTMRLVRGQTLRDAIAEHHERRRASHVEPLARQRLLQAFVSVCNAISYAHSRGVIHRDLKPANVILGGFGEVLLLDWGLAKVGSAESNAAGEQPTGAPPIGSVTDSSHAEATSAGMVMGTPAYMAPEQAEGRIDALDARTDIYGLGAILFEIITGRPPHSGQTMTDLLQKIVFQPPPLARTIEPSAPKALEAVCARAMARRREDRYQRAGDLADDVQRYLADEPVSVYREAWPARTARWLRRHRTLALSLAASLLIITIVSIVAAILIQAQKDIALTALAGEARERQRAEGELALAQDTIDAMLARWRYQRLAPLARHEHARREMLEVALKLCQGLLVQNPQEAGVRWRTGRARREVADISALLGRTDEARQEYRQAIALLEPLVREPSGDPVHRRELADAYNNVGNLLAHANQMPDAEKAYDQALDLLTNLPREVSREDDMLVREAAARDNLGIIYTATGRQPQAITAHQRAEAVYQSLVKREPGNVSYLQSLAASENNLGSVYRSVGQNEKAEEAIRAAWVVLTKLHADSPTDADVTWALASTTNNLAAMLALLRKADEAGAIYHRACDLFSELAHDFPGVRDFRSQLAATEYNRALFLMGAGRRTEAADAFAAAKAAFEPLASSPEADPADRLGLAEALQSLGTLELDAGKLDASEPLLKQSLAAIEKLAGDFPKQAAYQAQLSFNWQLLAELAQLRGLTGPAKEQLESAIRASQAAIELNPGRLSFRAMSASQLQRLANLLLILRETSEAAKQAEQIARLLPDSGDAQRQAAEILARCVTLASMTPTPGDDPNAWSTRAVELLRSAVAKKAIDAKTLEESPVFEALRKREDFQALIRQIEK